MKRVTLICDLQFGSTGKGLIAGYLAKRDRPDVLVTSWAPNAGHTFTEDDGTIYVHTMLANGVVADSVKYVLIAPGSVVNLSALVDEVKSCQHLGGFEVLIHPHAAIVNDDHRETESKGSMVSIGSTRKGSGAAVIDKIRRDKDSRIVAISNAEQIEDMVSREGLGNRIQVCSSHSYNRILDNATRVQIEGAQGYSLGINSGFWPYTTFRECTPQQILSDCLVPMKWVDKVIGCMRTYPIRVANRYAEDGTMVGWSGPCYVDQHEITFEEINQETELTTVTQLPRRIFTFSKTQTLEALRLCQPDEIFMNFANYTDENTLREIINSVRTIADRVKCGEVRYTGWGPKLSDIRDHWGIGR